MYNDKSPLPRGKVNGRFPHPQPVYVVVGINIDRCITASHSFSVY